MKNCKVCGDKTNSGFNIDFKLVPICEGCAAAIFLQQAQWYAMKESKNLKKLAKTFNKPHTLNQEYESK
jgi:hypothetical protein